MFVGLSKSFGNGLRIGIGTNLSKRPSQRDVARYEDAMFVRQCVERISKALALHAQSHGICVAIEQIGSVDDIPQSKADGKVLYDLAAEYQKRLQLYQDTGKINQSSKEKMLESVYSIENYLQSCHGDYPMGKVLDRWKNANLVSNVFMKIFIVGLFVAATCIYIQYSNYTSTGLVNYLQLTPTLAAPISAFLYFAFGKPASVRENKILASIPKVVSSPRIVVRQLVA